MLNIVYSNQHSDIFKANNQKKLIIVPEQFSHNFERLLCEIGTNEATKTAEVSSFKRMTDKIFAEIGGLAKTYINDSGRSLAMFNAISNVHSLLTVYKNRKSDNINKILAIIDEFKMYGVDENDLLLACENLEGNLKNKIQDLYYIYAEYNKITSHDLNDPRNELDFLCENFYNCTILNDYHIYFVAFDGFTTQQYNVIAQMLKKNLTVTIYLDLRNQDDKIYDLFCVERDTMKRLKMMCKINNFELIERYDQTIENKFDEIAQKIFEFDNNVQKVDDINLHISETVQKECMYVASEIIRLVRDCNYRFCDFIITSRNFESYKNYLEIALNRYEIPSFLADTESIENKMPIKVITDTLNMISTDFEIKSVFKYLKSPLSHINKDICDQLEDYVIRWDIKYLGENLKFTANPAFRLKKVNDEQQTTLDLLNQNKKIALAPIYKLKKNLATATVGKEFIEILYQYLLDIHLQANIIEYAKTLSDFKHKQQNLQIWDKIIDSIDQFYQICAEQHMDLDEFISLYTKTLQSYEVSTIPCSLDNVSAGEFEKIVAEKSKIMFILGADSSNLPKKIAENPILNDFDREILEINEINLSPFGSALITREFELIYKVFASPTEKLYVTMSEISPSGEITMPSKIFSFLQTIGQNLTTDSMISADFMLDSQVTYLEHQALHGKFSEYENYSEILQKSAKTYDQISAENLEKIYNKNISPSSIEMYNSCSFMHFLRYGLGIDERKVIKFDRLENGNFIHFVLEKILRSKDYDDKNISERINHYIEQYSTEFFGENVVNDDRFLYSFNNLKKNTYSIIKNVIDEINDSEFKPCDFELEINQNSQIKPLEIGNFNIVGKVDRVDIYEDANSVNLRVIDYKSGVKKLDLSTFNHGINMQMMIYMLILQESGFYDHAEKLSDSKGILYVPTKYPKITSDMPIYSENRQKEINSALKRSGILIEDTNIIRKMEKNDPFLYLPVGLTKKEEFSKASSVASEIRFGAMENLIKQKLKETISNMENGKITANPYNYEQKSPCDYCKFMNCCSFCDDYNKKRQFEKLSKDEFFEKLGV